jgi:putative FmdB family regulatory protein
MPLYEYTCTGCGDHFELLVRANEKPACPDCGSTRVEKQLSVPAAHTAKPSSSLPVCQPQPRSGGCGAPWCGTGGCGM